MDQKTQQPIYKGLKDLKILWYFLRNHKVQVVFVFWMMVVSSLLEAVNLIALYPVINYGLKMQGQSIELFTTFLNFFHGDNLFLSSCILLIILSILASLSKVYYHYLSNKLIMKVVSDNQNKIFQKLISAEYKYFVKSQQGKLIYASTVAPIGISNNIFSIIRIVNLVVTIGLLVSAMMFLVWQGMVFVVTLGVLYVVFVRKVLNHFVNHHSHLNVFEEEKKNVILNEFVAGIKSIKAFHNEKFWQDQFSKSVARSVLFRFKVTFGHVLPDTFLKFIFFAGIGIAGVFLSVYYKGDALVLLPALGTFAIVTMRLIPYINLLGTDIISLSRYMPDVKVVYYFLQEPMTEHWSGTKILEHFERGIQFKDVWFKYESADDYLFEGVNLSIPKGKLTAIVGSSGSGKSTIVNLLLCLFPSAKGQVLIDGIDLKELSKESYLKHIGYVSQETFIYHGTIKDNICFGSKNYSDDQIIRAAKLANAHEFILEAEKGYDTIVGDSGVKLSGGQRQRLAIARAMLRNPEILILDEATSSLDNVSERQVQQAINNIAKQATILIIAHRLSTVQNADKIIVLEKGKVVEEGNHQELLGKENVYFKLYKNVG